VTPNPSLNRDAHRRAFAHRRAPLSLSRQALIHARVMNLSDNTPFALVCGGFGLVMLVLIFSSLREAAAMKRWPVARGRVLSSKVEEYRADAGSGNFGGPRGRLTLYRPVVVYEYEVDGQRFRGDRIAQSPGMNKGVADFAQKIVQRYASGSAVDVRFNPKRPGESVLEPRVPKAWIFALVIAVALLILSVHMY
jgi:Protein of unknown function (DUF3592)